MVSQVLHCPSCQGTAMVRPGKTPHGPPRDRGHQGFDRGRTVLLDDSSPGQSPSLPEQMVAMAMTARGSCDTARV
jgi:hypothetical protein